jgi:hypothetical protein
VGEGEDSSGSEGDGEPLNDPAVEAMAIDAVASGELDADLGPRLVMPKRARREKGQRLTSDEIRLARTAHERLGHMAPSTMALAIRSGTITNLPPGLTAALVEQVFKVEQCVVCEAARRLNEVTPSGSGAIPGIRGSRWSYDTIGPIWPPSPEGYRYLDLFSEATDSTKIGIPAKSTGADVYSSLRQLLELCDSLEYTPMVFQTDAGPTESSKEFAATLAGWNAMVTHCAAERQRANQVERGVHPLVRNIEALLASAPHANNQMWLAAAFRVIDMTNSTPNARTLLIGNGTQSPKELFYRVKTDYEQQWVFGCPCTWPKTGPHQQLTLRNKIGIWVGCTVSGRTMVYEARARTPVIRDGLQQLRLIDDKLPTLKELAVILGANVHGPNGSIEIIARSDEVFSLRQWLARVLNNKVVPTGDGELDVADRAGGHVHPPGPELQRGDVGRIEDLGMNALAGLRQPVPPPRLTRQSVRLGIARENGQAIVTNAVEVDAEGDAVRAPPIAVGAAGGRDAASGAVPAPAPAPAPAPMDVEQEAILPDELGAGEAADAPLQSHLALACLAISGSTPHVRATAQHKTGEFAVTASECESEVLFCLLAAENDEAPPLTMDHAARKASLDEARRRRAVDRPR